MMLKKSVWATVGMLVVGAAVYVPAELGQGIPLGESTLVPYLDLGIGYDSNINLRGRALGEDGAVISEPNSDSFYTVGLGLRLNRSSEQYSHNLEGFWRSKRYSDDENLDNDAYGIRLGLRFTDQNAMTSFGINGSAEQITDISSFSADPVSGDIGSTSSNVLSDDASERLERDYYRLDALLHHSFSHKTYGEIGYAYHARDYLDDLYYDSANNDATLAFGYRVSGKTSLFLRGGYGVEDNDSYADAATTANAQLGVRNWGAEKLIYDIGIGYQYYDRSDTIDTTTEEYQALVDAGAVSTNLEDSSPKFDAALSWMATDKLTARLSAYTGYVSSSFSQFNGSRVVLGQLDFTHRTTRRLRLALILSYRENDFIDPVLTDTGELVDETRETALARLEATYGQNWFRLFARAWYEDSTSNIPGETYDRTYVVAGVRLQY